MIHAYFLKGDEEPIPTEKMLGDVIRSVALLAFEVCCEEKKPKTSTEYIDLDFQRFKPLKWCKIFTDTYLPVFCSGKESSLMLLLCILFFKAANDEPNQ